MFRFFAHKTRRRRRPPTAARRLNLERVESRVLLSGDGLIDLGQLLTFADKSDWSGVSFEYVRDHDLAGDAGVIVSLEHLFASGGAVGATTPFTNSRGSFVISDRFSGIVLNSDAFGELNLPKEIERLVPPAPFDPAGSEMTIMADRAPDPLIALGPMLRHEASENEPSLVLRAATTTAEAMTVGDLLLQQVDSASQPASSPAPSADSALALAAEADDASRLERSWSLEVASAESLEADPSRTLPRPIEQRDIEESDQPQDPVTEALESLLSTRAAGRGPFAVEFAGEPTPTASPVATPKPARDADQQPVRDAAFAGWLDTPRTQHHALAGAALALLTASRMRAGRTSDAPDDRRAESKAGAGPCSR